MGRIPREKIKTLEEERFYHVMSHSVWEAREAFSEKEKSYFVELLKRLSSGFLVEIISFSVMSNHFHIFLRTKPVRIFTDDEILRRAEIVFKKSTVATKEPEYWREILGDISFFMKELKVRFTRWYNKNKSRKGHLWSGRFKAILVENGKSAVAVSSYIDLNPYRAGIYRDFRNSEFTSIKERIKKEDTWMVSLDEIYEGLSLEDYIELLSFLTVEREYNKRGGEQTLNELVKVCSTYKGKGVVFGSKHFLENLKKKLKNNFRTSPLLA